MNSWIRLFPATGALRSVNTVRGEKPNRPCSASSVHLLLSECQAAFSVAFETPAG
jgi:hypothetical protein